MKRVLGLTAGLVLAAVPAAADEIEDTLNSALKAYKDGDVQYALEELSYAQQLLNAIKANALQGFLPEAPDGWTREFDQDTTSGMAAMGGTGAAAVYSNGSERFTVTLLTNSPMVMGLAGVFANPAVLASQGKLVKVGREKFIAQSENQLMGVIDSRVLVQAEGAAPEVMVPILEQIDFRALGRFGL